MGKYKISDELPISSSEKFLQDRLQDKKNVIERTGVLDLSNMGLKDGDLKYINNFFSYGLAPIQTKKSSPINATFFKEDHKKPKSFVSKITEINLSGNKLTKLPNIIFFPNLKILNLDNNNIRELSESIFTNGAHLDDLSLFGNDLDYSTIRVLNQRGEKKIGYNQEIGMLGYVFTPRQLHYLQEGIKSFYKNAKSALSFSSDQVKNFNKPTNHVSDPSQMGLKIESRDDISDVITKLLYKQYQQNSKKYRYPREAIEKSAVIYAIKEQILSDEKEEIVKEEDKNSLIEGLLNLVFDTKSPKHPTTEIKNDHMKHQESGTPYKGYVNNLVDEHSKIKLAFLKMVASPLNNRLGDNNDGWSIDKEKINELVVQYKSDVLDNGVNKENFNNQGKNSKDQSSKDQSSKDQNSKDQSSKDQNSKDKHSKDKHSKGRHSKGKSVYESQKMLEQIQDALKELDEVCNKRYL